MSQRVQLPPGCYGLDVPGGQRYDATRPGGHVTVDDRDATTINKANGTSGMLRAGVSLSFGTRVGKRCDDCGFLGQSWTQQCPKCSGTSFSEE